MPDPAHDPDLHDPDLHDHGGYPTAALLATHEQLRLHVSLLEDLVPLPDLSGPRVRNVAMRAQHAFAEELADHVSREDESLAPRLRRAVPGSGTLLDELARGHADVQACLFTLLAHLGLLAEGRPVPRATFRASVEHLRSRLLPRLHREETELFPLCAALSLADRVAIAREFAPRHPSER